MHRDAYLDYDALTALLERWAADHPDFVRLSSLGTTPGGRELWMLTVGTEPDRVRPTILVDGNMHASELAGSSVALAFAEALIDVHRGASERAGPMAETLRELRAFVVPRVSPDGAEKVLKTGAYVRSSPENDRRAGQHAHWVSEDLDGDGLAFVMRVEDATGELVESPEFPGLLVPRELSDTGPFYKVYPEGTIANFDGENVPDPFFLGDNRVDFNRNFPYHWMPEHKQVGAGAYPASAPEVRAMVELTTAHPEIFCWVNHHTFGGVLIRPLGAQPDTKLHPSDRALFRQIEKWAEDFTGYPTVPGVEFVYEPETPLHGDLTDFAWHARGALAWVVELWDLFEQVGLPRTERFVDRYTRLDKADLVALAKWDAAHNRGRIVRPWTPIEHPQLGPVEVGGLDPRIGLWNPPPERLSELCDQHVELLLHAAALSPRLHLEVEAEDRGELTVLTVTVENRGYLATRFVHEADGLVHNEPLSAVLTRGEAVGPDRVELGHLEGWGRGRWDGSNALYFQRTRGSVGRRVARFAVRSGEPWTVRVGSCRVGWLTRAG